MTADGAWRSTSAAGIGAGALAGRSSLGQCQAMPMTKIQNSKPTSRRNGGQRQSKMQNSRKAIMKNIPSLKRDSVFR